MTSENTNGKPVAASTSHRPFWNPWGPWGCLWRTLLFLLGMAFICFILAVLLKGCEETVNEIEDDPLGVNDQKPWDNEDNDGGNDDDDPYRDLPPEYRDTTFVHDWNDSIPGVDELPAPDDNYIPPIDTTDVVRNPEDSVTQIVRGQLIVFFNSQDVKSDMATFAQKFKQIYPDADYKVIYYNVEAGTMLLTVPEDRLIQVADELPQKITGIDFYVTTNDVFSGTAFKPSDPGFTMPWNDEYFKLIQTYDAWDITKGDSSVTVAIVDSYFDLSNPEIGQRFRDPINISTKRKYVLPPTGKPADVDEAGLYSHGSHVAGLAIGGQDNGLGCSGIAPQCKWIPVALGAYPWSMVSIIEGVLYSIYHGADVVNMSLGCITDDMAKLPLGDQVSLAQNASKRAEAAWEFILKTAYDHKCVIVKAAGNEAALMGMDFQNRSNQIVNVEAVDGKGIATEFSNFGKVPEANLNYSTVSAPGLLLWSVAPKNCIPTFVQYFKSNGIDLPADEKTGFIPMQGTSMACPVVTGAVALLKSKKKDLTTDQVIKILTMTAKQFDTKHRIGPTIQLKDALNATGGELANFDDLMKDHNLLIGKWKSTHELILDSNGKTVDEMWTYFIFDSPNSGVIEHHTINTNRVYKAKLNVQWGSDQIYIKQLSRAIDNQGNQMVIDNFVCHPNANRMLEADCVRNQKKQFTFMLEKVN